jgi:hypothetical protein
MAQLSPSGGGALPASLPSVVLLSSGAINVVFSCDYCYRLYWTLAALQAHVRDTHASGSGDRRTRPAFSCPFGRSVSRLGGNISHV